VATSETSLQAASTRDWKAPYFMGPMIIQKQMINGFGEFWGWTEKKDYWVFWSRWFGTLQYPKSTHRLRPSAAELDLDLGIPPTRIQFSRPLINLRQTSKVSQILWIDGYGYGNPNEGTFVDQISGFCYPF
jgi:hypothetical protein